MKITVSPQPLLGDVRFIRHGSGFLGGSGDEHYLVVLIPEYDQSKSLVVGVVTSQVEKRIAAAKRNNFDPDTIVTIDPTEYKELRVKSAIDCNSVKKLLKPYYDSITKDAIVYPQLPREIIIRILNGIIKSDNVSDAIKNVAKNILPK